MRLTPSFSPYFIAILLILAGGLALSQAGCLNLAAAPPVLPTIMATAPAAFSTLPPPSATSTTAATPVPIPAPATAAPTATPTASPTPLSSPEPTRVVLGQSTTIGYSRQGRPIQSYQFKNGPNKIIFIGGIHGGYEWNTILLAFAALDYFGAYAEQVPDSVTLHIIPSANPDGQFLVTGLEGPFFVGDVRADTFPGRFNAAGVDLNRNWDCRWVETATWRDQPVSGGERPFSEPESVALRDFIVAQNPVAVVFWHSAFGGVFAAGCPDTYQPALELANVYSAASGYRVYEAFTSYPITGDAGDWLSTQDVAAISVELTNHQELEWRKNLAGMLAVLDQYD